MGAYTALWAGISDELTLDDSGGYGLSPPIPLSKNSVLDHIQNNSSKFLADNLFQ